MQNIQATLAATFQNGTLILSGHSPNIEDLGKDQLFVVYLYILSRQGWRITRAVFEGFTLNLELEKTATVTFSDPLDPAIPVYLFHSFCITSFGSVREQKALSEKFKEAIRADGWKELCTSKLLRTTGDWILSLWMR
jgi:hypothetical protein